MIGLVGICTGSGGLFGGTLFMFGGKIVSKIQRLYVLIGIITVQFSVYGLTLANIPLVANIEGTKNLPSLFPETNLSVVLLTGFCLGFGDAGIKYVMFTTISEIWRHDPAPAYALMNVRVAKIVVYQCIGSSYYGLWTIQYGHTYVGCAENKNKI